MCNECLLNVNLNLNLVLTFGWPSLWQVGVREGHSLGRDRGEPHKGQEDGERCGTQGEQCRAVAMETINGCT